MNDDDRRTINRPTVCGDCGWVGRFGHLLIHNGDESNKHCPKCNSLNVRYVMVPMPERVQ